MCEKFFLKHKEEVEKMRKRDLAVILSGLTLISAQALPGWGFEVNEKLSFEGTSTIVYQWLDGSNIESKK